MQRTLISLALMLATSLSAAAPWTYRGTLNDAGKPANGNYDLRLTFINAAGTQSASAPITLFNVPVKDGNFSAEVEFGIELSQAPALLLKTEVAQGNSGFVSLGEPTPFDPKAALAGICWDTTGNVVAAGEFLGASNDVGVEIKANNLRVARFKAAGSAASYGDAPQVVLGSAANVASGIGGTVGGGGATLDAFGSPVTDLKNIASGLFATTSGGLGNSATGIYSTLGGGRRNEATRDDSSVSGGAYNAATGIGATVGGGQGNSATGLFSAVNGGFLNCAGGDYSWAGGANAKIRPGDQLGDGTCAANSGDPNGDNGTFVWADDQLAEFISTGSRQFLIRSAGGVAINTNTPTPNTALTVNGNLDMLASGSVGFGLITRQMLNLYSNTFGVGVQTARMYFRVADTGAFNWFEGGVHNDAADNAGGGTRHMNLSTNGQLTTTTGTISTISDARLKTDVHNYTGALDQIAQLRPVQYRYINAGKADFQPIGEHLGFIAQEVQTVFPQWVNTDDSGYLSLSMRGFEAVAVKAMQELHAENTLLRARLDRLEARLAKE